MNFIVFRRLTTLCEDIGNMDWPPPGAKPPALGRKRSSCLKKPIRNILVIPPMNSKQTSIVFCRLSIGVICGKPRLGAAKNKKSLIGSADLNIPIRAARFLGEMAYLRFFAGQSVSLFLNYPTIGQPGQMFFGVPAKHPKSSKPESVVWSRSLYVSKTRIPDTLFHMLPSTGRAKL